MEQNKNKEASFGSRETKHEETQSAHESARQKREEALERARRKKEVCEAYDALCRILDERKILLAEIKAIELCNLNGERCPEEAGSVFSRITDNNERELLYIYILTGSLNPEIAAIEI